MPKFQVYYSKGHDYRWRLKADNGEIVAVSEGYTERYSAKRAALRVKEIASDADEVEELS